MHTGNLVPPAVRPVATRSRAINVGTPAGARDRRRRLLQALAGPANTPLFHRPPRNGRHDQSTRPAAEADHRCASRRP